MKKLITILVLILTIVGCSPEDDTTQTLNTTLTSIAKGNLLGAGNEGIFDWHIVVTSTEHWNSLKNQMNSVFDVTDTFTETEVDFSHYIVIAAFDEIRISSGYNIELDVIWNSENVQVSATKSYSDENLIHSPTQPFHIIRINTTDLPILFQ